MTTTKSSLVGAVDYTSRYAPKRYCCADCNANQCKLWRDTHVLATAVRLRCVWCAARKQDRPGVLLSINDDGQHFHPEYRSYTDQIGAMVPAVPDEEGESFWGYTSIPEAAGTWWRRLPTFPKN